MTNHWANSLIGRAWTREFKCWDLVREVFSIRHGVTMPEEACGVLALKSAAQVSGWRPAREHAMPDDIVLMRNARGNRHVGVMIEANGRLLVLHNDGFTDEHGVDQGSVVATPLRVLAAEGCSNFEFWRRFA